MVFLVDWWIIKQEEIPKTQLDLEQFSYMSLLCLFKKLMLLMLSEMRFVQY